MKCNSEIQNYMTKVPHGIGADQPLSIARKIMEDYNIRHLPVRAGGKLTGVISDRDITFAIAFEQTADEELLARDIETESPYIASPQTSLKEVIMELSNQKIGCALIAENDEVVGIFTVTDALKIFSDFIQEENA